MERGEPKSLSAQVVGFMGCAFCTVWGARFGAWAQISGMVVPSSRVLSNEFQVLFYTDSCSVFCYCVTCGYWHRWNDRKQCQVLLGGQNDFV